MIVLDPFAGGCVRGIVSAALGLHYVGIDVSGKQIEANRGQWKCAVEKRPELKGLPKPTWLEGDGEDIVSLFRSHLRRKGLPDNTPADFVIGCPPYYDLEKYNAGVARHRSPKRRACLAMHPQRDRRV